MTFGGRIRGLCWRIKLLYQFCQASLQGPMTIRIMKSAGSLPFFSSQSNEIIRYLLDWKCCPDKNLYPETSTYLQENNFINFRDGLSAQHLSFYIWFFVWFVCFCCCYFDVAWSLLCSSLYSTNTSWDWLCSQHSPILVSSASQSLQGLRITWAAC